jgi:hypothetical protein
MLTAVNAAFAFVNKRSISAAVTSVNRINAAFTNVNATALNVRGVVSKTSQVRSTYCAGKPV